MQSTRHPARALALTLLTITVSGCGGGDPHASAATSAATRSRASSADTATTVTTVTTADPATAAVPARSTKVDPAEAAWLYQQAQRLGAVRVVVAFAHKVNVFAPARQRAAQQALAAADAAALRAQLGPLAWTTAYEDSGFGFAFLYVTAEGLALLEHATYVDAIRRKSDDTIVFRGDGSQDEIEATLARDAQASVDVLLDLEALAFELAPDGQTRFLPSAEQARELQQRWPEFLAGLTERQVPELAALRDPPAGDTPWVRLRITYEGLVGLRHHRLVRAIKPAGFVDRRPQRFEWPDAARLAAGGGHVTLWLGLREGPAFSYRRGPSRAAALRTEQAYQRAWQEVLAPLGPAATPGGYRRGPHATIQVDAAALQQLMQHPDARLLYAHPDDFPPLYATAAPAAPEPETATWPAAPASEPLAEPPVKPRPGRPAAWPALAGPRAHTP